MADMEEEVAEDHRARRNATAISVLANKFRTDILTSMQKNNSNEAVGAVTLAIVIELLRSVSGRMREDFICEAPGSTMADLSPQDRSTIREALLQAKDAWTLSGAQYEEKYYPLAGPKNLSDKLEKALKLLS